MKRYIIYFFALCMMFTLASCDKDEPALPDPPETETLEEGGNENENPDAPNTPSEHKTLIAYYSYTNKWNVL